MGKKVCPIETVCLGIKKIISRIVCVKVKSVRAIAAGKYQEISVLLLEGNYREIAQKKALPSVNQTLILNYKHQILIF